MASFNLKPTLKPTVLLAGIFSNAPVDGLRPVRAARSFTEMLAKPGRIMESPFTSRSVRQLITAFNAVSESVLVNFDVAQHALKDYYNELAQAIIHDADGGQAAIERFREAIRHQKEIRQGKIFSLQHLIAAYAAYTDNFDALGTWHKRDLFWNQVIGYVQRQMSTYDAQVHCSGVQSVLDDPARFKRSLKFSNGGEFLPPAVNSGLGFDFAACGLWPSAGGAGVFARDVDRLCRAKTGALAGLRESLEPRASYHP